MFNLQGSEIIVILLLALVVLGPEKLPDAIRKFSQTYGELKKMGNGFQSELKSALDEPMREMRETADLVQRAADPKRLVEEAEDEARLRAKADAASAAGVTDVPVDPAALEALDPAAESERDSEDDVSASPGVPPSEEAAPVSKRPALPVNGSYANGHSPKVNQIALSMARGPIAAEPAMAEATAAPMSATDTATESATDSSTHSASTDLAPPSGAPAQAMMPPSSPLPPPTFDDRPARPAESDQP